MAKMKEAAVLEMYFKVLPEIAANVAAPLQQIDSITMYGEGNTTKMIEDITKSTTQITEGLTAGLGIDMKSVLAGALGTKLLSDKKEKGISVEDVKEIVKTVTDNKKTNTTNVVE